MGAAGTAEGSSGGRGFYSPRRGGQEWLLQMDGYRASWWARSSVSETLLLQRRPGIRQGLLEGVHTGTGKKAPGELLGRGVFGELSLGKPLAAGSGERRGTSSHPN